MAHDYYKKAWLQNEMNMYTPLVWCESSCIEIMINCKFVVSLENKQSPIVKSIPFRLFITLLIIKQFFFKFSHRKNLYSEFIVLPGLEETTN